MSHLITITSAHKKKKKTYRQIYSKPSAFLGYKKTELKKEHDQKKKNPTKYENLSSTFV